MTQLHADFTRGNLADFGHWHRFHPMFSLANNSLTFFSDQHRSCKFLKFILPWKMNFEHAVTNAHFAPLHRPLFGQIPSQPRRISSANSASVTSDISQAEWSAAFRLRFCDGRSAPVPFRASLRLRFTFPFAEPQAEGHELKLTPLCSLFHNAGPCHRHRHRLRPHQSPRALSAPSCNHPAPNFVP